MMLTARVFCLFAALLTIGTAASAQTAQPVPQTTVKHTLDSGIVRNLGPKRSLIYSGIVQGPQSAPWVRLLFSKAELGRTPIGGLPTMLKMTSLLDGKFQTMNPVHLQQWQNSSAYFNGNSVLIEIFADPGAGASHLAIDEIIAGLPAEGGIASICGSDDRVLSDDPKAARIMPIGCTGWIIDDANHCFLSAGHCSISNGIIQFNVPLSSAGGAVQNPGPEDQYAVNNSTTQSVNGGIGNDWWYFGCFPNTNTGLTPYQAQQDFYILADAAPAVNGQTIRITGYGVDSSPPESNQVQQTNAGPYTELSGTTVRYQVDTTGGNSGSGVLNETDGVAIGIHTHAGCSGGGGSNQGTAIHNAGLQNALANPQATCIAMPSLEFVFPDGVPSMVNPGGDSIRVEIEGANGGVPAPGTGKVYFNGGSGFVEIAMSEVEPNIYDAILPGSACGANVKFYFSAESSRGEAVLEPPLGAPAAYGALSAAKVVELVYDPIETVPQNWSKSADSSLTSGAWVYGNPNGTSNNGTQAAPENDATPGAGVSAWISDNGPPGGSAEADDVDGGPAQLVSPTVALQGFENAIISYSQWVYASSSSDQLTVEVTNNNGASWIPVATVAGTGSSWQNASFAVSDFVEPTNQVRVRFSISDGSPDHIVEAGIDEFRVLNVVCGACAADITGDQSVNVDDLLAIINNWGACPGCAADVSPAGGNDIVDVDDLLMIINAWGTCQ